MNAEVQMPKIEEYVEHNKIFSGFPPFAEHMPSLEEYVVLAAYQVDCKITSDKEGEPDRHARLSLIANTASYWKCAGIVSMFTPSTGRIYDHVHTERNDESAASIMTSMIAAIQRYGEVEIDEKTTKVKLVTVPLKLGKGRMLTHLESQMNEMPVREVFGEEVFNNINSCANNIAVGEDISNYCSEAISSSALSRSKSGYQRFNRTLKEANEVLRKARAEIEARVQLCGEAWASW